MSNTSHLSIPKLGEFHVHLDELVPHMTVSMRKSTYEEISGTKLVDHTLPKRGEPGSIPRAGRPQTVDAPAPGPPVVDQTPGAKTEPEPGSVAQAEQK
jgi:hypothetical protein